MFVLKLMVTLIDHTKRKSLLRTDQQMWLESHEHILREWKAKCFVNLWLHTTSSYYYAKIHDLLTFPIIILSSVSSATLFTGITDDTVKYVISIITIFAGVLTVVTRQMRPGELYQEYSNLAKRYKSLIRMIDTCLELPMELRIPADVFIERIKNEINTLSSSQLFPPLYVLKSFEKKFGSLEQKLFGEDIVEILNHDIKTRKLVKRIQRSVDM